MAGDPVADRQPLALLRPLVDQAGFIVLEIRRAVRHIFRPSKPRWVASH